MTLFQARARALIALGASSVLAGCAEHRTLDADAAPGDARSPTREDVVLRDADAGAHDSEDARVEVDGEARWPFVAHAVERCYVDRLASSEYLTDWVAAGGLERARPEGDPVPSPSLSLPTWGPSSSSREFAAAAESLRRQLDPSRSHVMDCTLSVRAKDPPHTLGAISYSVYLPGDYLRHPLRRRGALLMVPGGRGDRTRWFLTPREGSLYERGTGGLSLRSAVDQWASAHAGASVPLVITVDGPTGRWIDGRVEFIANDLPQHVARTYLPQQREDETPFGVQAISVGAAFTVRAMRAAPTRFSSVALMGLFCDRTGVLPERDLGPDVDTYYQELASRVRQGAFAMRMSIGRRDPFYECNKRWYFALQSAGVFAAQTDPTYERCEGEGPPSSARCWVRWPGFTGLPRLGHHYAAVVPVFAEDLAWQLDRLDALARSRGQ
ncbi:MAG: hypothetical protein JNK05_02160 [Myxococcales bacterium]|nr:hypothetical protein [Myxococcales bacterium]